MQVPVIVPATESEFAVARRLYFTRFMDLLITELFEALSYGHYLWKCGVCGKYFLMTTAHKKLYCSDVNEEYGVPCSYAASHPDVINKKLEKESKKNSPIYILWQRRITLSEKTKATANTMKKYLPKPRGLLMRNVTRHVSISITQKTNMKKKWIWI